MFTVHVAVKSVPSIVRTSIVATPSRNTTTLAHKLLSNSIWATVSSDTVHNTAFSVTVLGYIVAVSSMVSPTIATISYGSSTISSANVGSQRRSLTLNMIYDATRHAKCRIANDIHIHKASTVAAFLTLIMKFSGFQVAKKERK